MAGRRKADKKTKEITGAKTRPEPEVIVVAEAPCMPEYFKKSKTLPLIWGDVVEDLDRLNILSRTDAGTVEAYCITLDRMRRMQAQIMEEGESYLTKTKNGPRRLKNPDVDTLMKCVQQLKAYAIEMGCTPASRSKVPSLLQPSLFENDKKSGGRWANFN